MSDTPTTVHDDEALEARIVSWVLGEASAFEAAELERLCEARPDLLAFQRRMLALHGLLTEAETALPDDAWKLPPEKRKALEEVLGKEKAKSADPLIEKRIRRAGLGAIFATAACVLLTFVILHLLHPSWMMRTVHQPEKKVDFMVSARSEGNESSIAMPDEPASPPMPPVAAAGRRVMAEASPAQLSIPQPSSSFSAMEGASQFGRNGGQADEAMGEKHDDTIAMHDADPFADANSDPRLLSARKPVGQDAGGGSDGAGAKEVQPMDIAYLQSSDSSAAPGVWESGELSKRIQPPTADRSDANPVDREISVAGEARKPTAAPVLRERMELAGGKDSGTVEIAPSAKSRPQSDLASQKDAAVHDPRNLDQVSLNKAIREQEDKVEERRKVLATIVRTKGVIYQDADSFYGQASVDEDQGAKNELQKVRQLEQEKMQLESQLESLQKYDSEQLVVYASGLDLPDNALKVLYPEYLDAKRQLDSLNVNGLGDDHPAVVAAREKVGQQKRQLDEGVVNLRQTLQAQLDLSIDRLKFVETMNNGTRDEPIKRALDAQDFVDAKQEFETEQALLHEMRQKLLGVPAKAKAAEVGRDIVRLVDEIPTAEAPYSTFSLNISDASFRIAQAALAKGGQPDPAGIKVEQFYNAVDYGDPAPASGEPVALNLEQCGHPFIPGRNLVRVALKTAAAGRPASQALRLTLLVDQSGSMVREDRRAAMDKALAGLAGLLTEKDSVTVVGFSRTPRLLVEGLPGNQAGKLADIVNSAASEGGTNLEEAIQLAEQMARRHFLPGAQNRIVLFTDGAANLGNADPVRLAERVKQLRQKGIAFDIAGIAAEDLNDSLLGELARNGDGRFHVVGKGGDDNFAQQLAGAFRPAAENVKVQVRFNPERVGRYKLIGFEKDRLQTEDFRNDAVDAAELAAGEAGVAIYQVEPLAEGKGELGEVSVRFRDTASGEMVERTWTIRHEAAAPAVDRATPSMQLAMLSLFAAQKLQGGPLADAIDFQQLSGPRANIRRFYGDDSRAGAMLRLVDALK